MKNRNQFLYYTLLPLLISTTANATLSSHTISQYKKYHVPMLASSNDGVLPGMGYSSDTASFAPTVCFNPLTITRSGQSSFVNFDTAESVAQIAGDLNIAADFNSDFNLFNANGLFNYMNQIKEDEYSISLNYLQKVSNTVNLTFSYSPRTILNDTGRDIYQDGTNPFFRIFCGDRLIPSYEEGAVLIMSMKIHFRDKTDKQTFVSHIGMGIGNFFNASAQIQNVASQYHMNGYINVSAFQLGGDPTQLSKILSPALPACDINNVAKCQEAAGTLISYANNVFPAEFTHINNVWTSPLVPLGAYTKGYHVSDFGMKLAPTFITQEVVNSRAKLVSTYQNQLANYRGLKRILDLYPIPLDGNYKSALMQTSNTIKSNLNLFEMGVNGDGGARDCWLFPNNCATVTQNLLSHLAPITPDILNPLTAPIIKMDAYGGAFWPNGGYGKIDMNSSWSYQSYTPSSEQGWNIFSIVNATGELRRGSMRNSVFTGSGIYHDGGSCPLDDRFIIKNAIFSGNSPTEGDTVFHQHSAGGCKGGDKDIGARLKFFAIPNPFYFSMLN